MLLVGQGWTFHPGDINLDGLVNCADVGFILESMYDWNLDGDVNEADLQDLTVVVGASLSDIDGNGIVDEADLEILIDNWGPCPDPPDPCPGDLDCDGIVGVSDFLLLVGG